MGLSAVGGLWTLLSLIITGLATFSFLQPYWFIHKHTLHSLGLFSFCVTNSLQSHTPTREGPFTQACGLYGGHFDFAHLPSNAWQVACVLYGGGCGVLAVCALLSLLVLPLPHPHDTRLAAVTGYIQTTAVVLMTAGLLTLPFGLSSPNIHDTCPGAWVYRPGNMCQIGWAYLLAIVATCLAFFAPFMAQYTDISLSSYSRHVPEKVPPPHCTFV